MGKVFRYILGCLFYFFAYTAMCLAAGSVVGGVAYMLVGFFTHPELSVWTRFHEGAWLGFRFVGVWAGGLAIVLCFIQARHMKRLPASK